MYKSSESSAAMRSSSPNVRASSACDACSHGSDEASEDTDDDDDDDDEENEDAEKEEDDDENAATSAEGRADAVDVETSMDKDEESEAPWHESVSIRGAKFLYDVGS